MHDMEQQTAPAAKRAPNDRGQGRKRLPAEMRTVRRSVSLTPGQWSRFAALGGSAWLRKALDGKGKAINP